MSKTQNVGDDYGLTTPEVPEGHQATLRPVEGSEVPQVSIEPVPEDPKPDMTEETTAAGIAAHRASQAEVQAAWAGEHEHQMKLARDAEIAAAGEPSNIGTDGKAHFLRMIPKAGADVSGDEHDPDDFHSVCGGCGEPWPCGQARALEDQARAALGLDPLPNTPVDGE